MYLDSTLGEAKVQQRYVYVKPLIFQGQADGENPTQLAEPPTPRPLAITFVRYDVRFGPAQSADQTVR